MQQLAIRIGWAGGELEGNEFLMASGLDSFVGKFGDGETFAFVGSLC